MQNFTENEKNILLTIARDSILSGFNSTSNLAVDPGNYPDTLQKNKACFVTLTINKRLRGCIGSLEARFPLVVDVANNAFSAAFKDPRFSPLDSDEFKLINLHISVLSDAMPLEIKSESELLELLVPGKDGLIIEEGLRYRATFLPSVWESLREPREFVYELKRKAGMPDKYWSDDIKVSRYYVDDIYQ